jgi:hypothetical protein
MLRADSDEAIPTHPIEQPLEGLAVHPEGFADLLVTVEGALFQRGEELPSLGVPQDVDKMLVRKSHHKR